MATRGNQHRPTVQAKRYRAGQVPKDYVDELSESSDEEQQEQLEQQLRPQSERQLQFAQKEVVTGLEKIEISEQEAASDRRLRRLRQAQQENAQTTEGRRRRRFTEAPEELDKDQDEEQRAQARLRMKERALQFQKEQEEEQRRLEEKQQEETAKKKLQQQEEEEEESSSEYETDSEDEEEDTIRRMPKPVFIPKAHRETVIQEEKRRQMEEERERRLEEELERRKQQSHDLLAQQLKREREEEAEKDLSKHQVEVDDTDFGDQAEFDAWKVRELRRIKRDREERIAREREQEEIERRRELPEDVRLKMDLEEAEKTRQKERGQFTFMQKYYHKGAFYQDKNDEVFRRDYSAPTVDEVRKKELLPKVMQVKNFGFAGRTKWTHLANEDTSARPEDDPWSNPVPHKRQRRK